MMMKPFLLFCAVNLLVLAASQEICNSCTNPKQHTMCQYPGLAERCGEDLASGVSDEEQTTIVDAHNKLRERIASGSEDRGINGPQPSASNMVRLKWDDGLAEVAQRWADQCDFRHDECRNDPRYVSSASQVGQNAAYSSSCDQVPNWPHMIQLWYDEVEDYDANDIGAFRFRKGIGHFSQVAWAETTDVGCGYRFYNNDAGCNQIMVCNYGPAGNFGGEPIYKPGEPRTGCPDSPEDPDYPSLCEELPEPEMDEDDWEYDDDDE